MHLFDIDIPGEISFRESDTLTAGEAGTVIDTPVGRLGVGICYDMRCALGVEGTPRHPPCPSLHMTNYVAVLLGAGLAGSTLSDPWDQCGQSQLPRGLVAEESPCGKAAAVEQIGVTLCAAGFQRWP